METNTDITIFHREIDDSTGIYVYKKIYYEFVNWQGGLGASINKGYEQANDVTMWIPKEENGIEDVNKFDFIIGDFVCKGKIEEQINKESDLKKYAQVFNIKTIIPQDLGDDEMQHIQIGAK